MRKLGSILAAALAEIEPAIAGVDGVQALVTRNAALGERMENGGDAWINLVDGAAVRPPEGANGGEWDHLHEARVLIGVRGADASAEREVWFDALVDALSDALPEGSTLGGLADWVAVQPVQTPDAEVLSLTIGFKIAEVPIQILYSAPTSAG